MKKSDPQIEIEEIYRYDFRLVCPAHSSSIGVPNTLNTKIVTDNMKANDFSGTEVKKNGFHKHINIIHPNKNVTN